MRHAGFRLALTVRLLSAAVGGFPGVRSLIASPGCGNLSAASHLPTRTAAIALSAITAPANSEQGVAVGILAPAESQTLYGVVGTHLGALDDTRTPDDWTDDMRLRRG